MIFPKSFTAREARPPGAHARDAGTVCRLRGRRPRPYAVPPVGRAPGTNPARPWRGLPPLYHGKGYNVKNYFLRGFRFTVSLLPFGLPEALLTGFTVVVIDPGGLFERVFFGILPHQDEGLCQLEVFLVGQINIPEIEPQIAGGGLSQACGYDCTVNSRRRDDD